MSIWSRTRFLFGVVFVVILVGLLVLYLNNTMSAVHADQANLSADTTNVGIDYPGLVMAQDVNEGDKVTKGETLFVVESPELTSDIASHVVTITSLPFSLDTSGNILVKANTNGVIQKIDYPGGSYVPGGVVMATLYAANHLYISGDFHLSPPDYARLKQGSTMDVTFPDDSMTQATVYNIALTQEGNTVETVVKAWLPQAEIASLHFPLGTPVEASLKLTNTTWWNNVRSAFNKLFRPRAG